MSGRGRAATTTTTARSLLELTVVTTNVIISYDTFKGCIDFAVAVHGQVRIGDCRSCASALRVARYRNFAESAAEFGNSAARWSALHRRARVQFRDMYAAARSCVPRTRTRNRTATVRPLALASRNVSVVALPGGVCPAQQGRARAV